MGGYGAIKFGLKYPEMFVLAGSFSGALGAATLDERTGGAAIARSLKAIFGPADGEIRKANDIFDIVRRAEPETMKTWPFLYIDCGTEDFLFQNNRDFVSLLVEKKVPHEYRQLPGAHNWQYWDKQVEEFLRVASRFLGMTRITAINDKEDALPGKGEEQLGRPVNIDDTRSLPSKRRPGGLDLSTLNKPL
jgi:S-formylglutathione hydrolase FrmB